MSETKIRLGGNGSKFDMPAVLRRLGETYGRVEWEAALCALIKTMVDNDLSIKERVFYSKILENSLTSSNGVHFMFKAEHEACKNAFWEMKEAELLHIRRYGGNIGYIVVSPGTDLSRIIEEFVVV